MKLKSFQPTREQLLRGSLTGRRVMIGPELAVLDVTDPCACQLQRGLWVRWCGEARHVGLAHDESEMPLKYVKRVARSLDQGGARRVVLGWRGDPLQHAEILEVVTVLRAHELEVVVQTCLCGATPELLRRLLGLPIVQIVVQLNGVPTGARLEAVQALGRTPLAQGSSRTPTRVNLTVSAGAEDQVMETFGWANRLGIDELRLSHDPLAPADPARIAEILGQGSASLMHTDGRGRLRMELGEVDQATLRDLDFVLFCDPGRLGGFRLDRREGVLICPRGLRSTSCSISPRFHNQIFADFTCRGCDACDLRLECPVNQVLKRLEVSCTTIAHFRTFLDPVVAAALRPARHDGVERTGSGPAASGPCLVPFSVVWIDGRGELWSCLPDAGSLGDCLAEGWSGPRITAYRERLMRGEGVCDIDTCGLLASLDWFGPMRRPLATFMAEGSSAEDAPGDRPGAGQLSALRERELRRGCVRRREQQAEQHLFELSCFQEELERSVDLHQRSLKNMTMQLERLERRSRALRKMLRTRVTPRRAPYVADDVLLVMTPLWGRHKPPLALAVLSEYLRHHGVRVSVLDLNIACYNRALDTSLEEVWIVDSAGDLAPDHQFKLLYHEYKRTVMKAVEQILASDVPIIAFSVNVRNYLFARSIANLIRQEDPKRLVVFGGPEVFRLHQDHQLDDEAVTLFVVGEGEETLLEIVRRHRSGGSLDGIPGVVSGGAGPGASPYAWAPRAPLMDLDRIPFPTYADFSLEDYEAVDLPFLFSRGCKGRCLYCQDHMTTGPSRCRSAEHAVAELSHHQVRYGVHQFNFNDLTCNDHLANLAQMCDLIVERRLDIIWHSFATIRPEMTDELLTRMQRSGCTMLNYGLETGSDKILKLMRKRYNLDLALDLLRRTALAGIEPAINIMVGFPGETDDDFEQTCDMLRRFREYISRVVNLSVFDIQKGSPLCERLDRFKIRFGPDGRWCDDRGNTHHLRLQRLKHLKRLLAELGVPLEIVNIN